MAAAIAVSPTEGLVYNAVTISLTGFSTNSAYLVNITRGSGGTTHLSCTTDGSGAATVTYVPVTPGSATITANLAAPAVEATTTYTVGAN